MAWERTAVGLDVHARSVVAGVLDTTTGQLWSRRLPAATQAVVARLVGCPARWLWLMRPARPGSGWPGRCRRPGWDVWWWRRPSLHRRQQPWPTADLLGEPRRPLVVMVLLAIEPPCPL